MPGRIGMNLSTVKSHLYRALAIVRERMGGAQMKFRRVAKNPARGRIREEVRELAEALSLFGSAMRPSGGAAECEALDRRTAVRHAGCAHVCCWLRRWPQRWRPQ